MPDTEVVIIGACLFGTSISAYLTALGIDHIIVGRPMDTWRTHMPDGMLMNRSRTPRRSPRRLASTPWRPIASLAGSSTPTGSAR